MKSLVSKIFLATAIISAGVVLTSCDKDDKEDTLPRLFSPSNIESEVTGDTQVEITWSYVAVGSERPVSYDLQIATDTLFTDIVYTFAGLETTKVTILTEGSKFELDQPYFPRVKANAEDSSKDSKYTVGASFKFED